jgi:drug/metabolite transporter (DMT)-like permease
MLTALSGPAHGIAWMLIATAAFVTSDTISKFLLETFPIAQVVWARYTAHFLIVLLLLRRRTSFLIKSYNVPLQIFRSLLLILATISFFAAVRTVPLATASSIMFTAPITVTLLSIPLLREPVGLHRWIGVLFGFIGALTIIRPGSSDWDPSLLWAVCASFMYALYQITTRALHKTDQPDTTMLYTAVIGAIAMLPFIPFNWISPDLFSVALMGLTGLISGVAHYSIIKAFSSAPASVITPFGYTNLIWATLFGYIVFSEFPDPFTFIGAGIIILSGLYILRSERKADA